MTPEQKLAYFEARVRPSSDDLASQAQLSYAGQQGALDVDRIIQVVKDWDEYDTRLERGSAGENEYLDFGGFYLFFSDLRSRLRALLDPGEDTGEKEGEGVPASPSGQRSNLSAEPERISAHVPDAEHPQS